MVLMCVYTLIGIQEDEPTQHVFWKLKGLLKLQGSRAEDGQDAWNESLTSQGCFDAFLHRQAPWFYQTLRMLEILRQNADGNVELEALPVDLGDVSDTDGLRLDRRGRISSQTKHKSPMDSIHEVYCQVGCFTVASIRMFFIFSRFGAISLSLSPIFPIIFLYKFMLRMASRALLWGGPANQAQRFSNVLAFWSTCTRLNSTVRPMLYDGLP